MLPPKATDSDQLMLSQDDMRERQKVEQVMSVMNQDDPEVARRMLRKWNGNVERAITAMLSDDTGVQDSHWPSAVDAELKYPPSRPQSPRHGRAGQPSPVIDLTGENEMHIHDIERDLNRAMKASMEPRVAFLPSERDADPRWAMVPSNLSNGDVSHEDQNLNRAIAASIDDVTDLAGDVYKLPPLDEQGRNGGRPVAMRPTSSTLVYAALLINGLYYVPQVRNRIANWRHNGALPPESGPEHLLWTLFELFAYLDYMAMAELNCDALLDPFDPPPWTYSAESPGDLSFTFLQKVASTIEPFLTAEKHRLFHFRYGDIASRDDSANNNQETFIVKVTVGTSSGSESTTNDLVSQLSSQLSQSNQKVIFDPSQVVAFQLTSAPQVLPAYSSAPPTYTGGAKKFKYPKFIYLDQFLHENAELANEKRKQQSEMSEEVQRLALKKQSLMHFKGKDTLKDLRSSIYYYEKVANAGDDLERGVVLETMATKLKQILVRIENEIKGIDERIVKLVQDSACLFDSADLQKHKYDLRVVFVHDGLFGRRNVYSYVQEKGIWWKVMDNDVTEVSEDTVLDDPAGLHLGAGPYMLLYSRALTPEEEARSNDKLPWPEQLKDSIKHNNSMFLEMLPPEKAALVLPMSPMSSPYAAVEEDQPEDMDLSGASQAEPSQMMVDVEDIHQN